MAKKTINTPDTPAAPAPPAGPVNLQYIGPKDAESPLLGPLVPGRCYQVNDAELAHYWVTHTPDHWVLAE